MVTLNKRDIELIAFTVSRILMYDLVWTRNTMVF